jgi:hypothetical protein
MTAPTTAQTNFYERLCTETGAEVQEYATMEDYRKAIDDLRANRPATERQINLCSALIRDHYRGADGMPTKALPPNPNELMCSNLIRSLFAKRPTMGMLVELAQLEKDAGISPGREPRTTQSLYERRQRARDFMGSDAIDQLIDAKDAEVTDWSSALLDAAHDATTLQDGETESETEGSSVQVYAATDLGPEAEEEPGEVTNPVDDLEEQPKPRARARRKSS